MKHGSLFSGMGGFDLAASLMGWENVFHCEINEFNQEILRFYWPKAITYKDVRKTDFTQHRGAIDILTGGFPCQPFSSSGLQLGENDERYLSEEMLRATREIKPPWVVAENVFGITGKKFSKTFEHICTSLEAERYEVQPFIIPASAKGAPHERSRVFFVAYSESFRMEGKRQPAIYKEQENGKPERFGTAQPSAYTSGLRLRGQIDRPGKTGFTGKTGPVNDWQNFPTQSPLCNGNDGVPHRLGSPAFSKWRKQALMSIGNAVVPQIALQIFKAIKEYENAII